MLTQHFKLNFQPFGVTPDGRFLYLSQTHREAIASLLYGIQACRGFTALIAPPGMGKTTVLLHMLGVLIGNARTSFLFQTLCAPEQFLRSLLTDLGIDNEGDDVAQMHGKLNAYLLRESKAGRQVVVVIDEAQNLDEPVLELVRMLSNFETPGKKLMHLILCGQPQLAEKLASERLTQLRQRISIVARLSPFSADETREYIDHRLQVAGAVPENTIFSRQAYDMIAAQSGGIPRNINNLCFNAMSLACALKKSQVDSSMVRETIDDLNLSTLIPAKDSSPILEKQRPILTMVPWLSLSRAWRYSAGIAIGLLVAAGLLAYTAAPLRHWVIRERPAASLRQRETSREPQPTSPSKTIAREEVNEQVAQSAPQVRTDGVPPAPQDIGPSGVQLRRQQGGLTSSHKSVKARRSATTSDVRPTADAPEIRLLPDDLVRLQHVQNSESSLKPQASPKDQVTSKPDQVPAESTPQRENR